MTVAVIDSVPLVRIVPEGMPVEDPTPGRYYEAADGRLLLCISRRGMDHTYYWFIDAADSPIIVLSREELRDEPMSPVGLVPVRSAPEDHAEPPVTGNVASQNGRGASE